VIIASPDQISQHITFVATRCWLRVVIHAAHHTKHHTSSRTGPNPGDVERRAPPRARRSIERYERDRCEQLRPPTARNWLLHDAVRLRRVVQNPRSTAACTSWVMIGTHAPPPREIMTAKPQRTAHASCATHEEPCFHLLLACKPATRPPHASKPGIESPFSCHEEHDSCVHHPCTSQPVTNEPAAAQSAATAQTMLSAPCSCPMDSGPRFATLPAAVRATTCVEPLLHLHSLDLLGWNTCGRTSPHALMGTRQAALAECARSTHSH